MSSAVEKLNAEYAEIKAPSPVEKYIYEKLLELAAGHPEAAEMMIADAHPIKTLTDEVIALARKRAKPMIGGSRAEVTSDEVAEMCYKHYGIDRRPKDTGIITDITAFMDF